MQPERPTTPGAAPARRRVHLVRAVGLLIAAAAVALCVNAVVEAWPQVRSSIAHVDLGWLLAAFAASAASMLGLGLLWWYCFRIFEVSVRPIPTLAWHFAGELGKYVPGGVWPVLGRAELARRGGGIRRPTGYATTLLCYAAMTIAAGLVCGLLAPLAAVRRSDVGWAWALVALVPLGLAAVHPGVLQRVLDAARRWSRDRIVLTAPSWPAMLRLIAVALPSWLLLGAAAAAITEGLGYQQDPVRVAFAAVAAWIVGFLAVPVPAGAGVRELVFVVLCGLAAGPATAVAAIARALLIVVDALGGLAGLAFVGATGRSHVPG